MEALIQNSTECLTLGKSASQENYVLTNRYLADHAQFLIAVSDHANALPADMTQMEAYVFHKNLGVVFIHPDTVEVKGVFSENFCRQPYFPSPWLAPHSSARRVKVDREIPSSFPA